MNSIDKVKSISVWIFIIPFISVNTCLLIVTQFHQILEPGVPISPTFPYLDGGVSIAGRLETILCILYLNQQCL
jgi:hypothetical protein